MPRICETQEGNGNGRERERERQFSSKGNVECENVASHFRVVTSNCTRKHWKFSRDRIFEREKEREFEYFTFALENFNRDECLFNTKIFSRRIFSFFFFFRRNRSRGGGAPIFSTLEQREIKRVRIYLYRETRRIFSKRRFFLFFPLSLEFVEIWTMREQTGVVACSSSFARSLFEEILKFCAWNIEDNQFDPWKKQELDTRLIRRLQRDATFSFEIRSIWSTTWT